MKRADMINLSKRITRAQRNVSGIARAAQATLDELDILAGIVNMSIGEMTDDTERAPRNGRVAKSPKVLTEADVLRVIDSVFGKQRP